MSASWNAPDAALFESPPPIRPVDRRFCMPTLPGGVPVDVPGVGARNAGELLSAPLPDGGRFSMSCVGGVPCGKGGRGVCAS